MQNILIELYYCLPGNIQLVQRYPGIPFMNNLFSENPILTKDRYYTMDQEKTAGERLWSAVAASTDLLREYALERNVKEDFSNATVRQLVVMKKVFTLTESKKGGIPLKRLAEELHLTAGTVSEVVDTLVRKGGLVRVINPADRRSVMIRLTEKSQNYQNILQETAVKKLQSLIGDFSEQEIAQAIKVMEVLMNKLSKEKD